MPELHDQAEKRAIDMLSQVAHVKIETEDIPDIVSELSNASTSNKNKKRVKVHVKSIKVKEQFANASDSEWR